MKQTAADMCTHDKAQELPSAPEHASYWNKSWKGGNIHNDSGH